MEHKKHIINIIKLGVVGVGVCLAILIYAFFLSWRGDQINPTGEVFTPAVDSKGFELKTYTDIQNDFQIDIPNELSQVTDSNEPNLKLFFLNEKLNVSVAVIINTAEELAGTSFDAFVNDFKQVHGVSRGFESISDESIIVNGLNARLVKAKGDINQDIDAYWVFINDSESGNIYFLLAAYNKALPDIDKTQLLNSLLSFKLLK